MIEDTNLKAIHNDNTEGINQHGAVFNDRRYKFESNSQPTHVPKIQRSAVFNDRRYKFESNSQLDSWEGKFKKCCFQ